MSGVFFRGTTVEQDGRFGDKAKKLQSQLSFPDIYSRPVDITKVNVPLLKPWVTERVTTLLGMEDEVLVSFIINSITPPATSASSSGSSKSDASINPKDLQINVTGFLGASAARELITELWGLLVSASSAPGGVAPELLQWQRTRSGTGGGADAAEAVAIAKASQPQVKPENAAQVSSAVAALRARLSAATASSAPAASRATTGSDTGRDRSERDGPAAPAAATEKPTRRSRWGS